MLLLTSKLLNQGFLLVKLKSSLRKFYGRHHDLVDRYGISVTNDHGYVPLVVNTSRSFPHYDITGFATRPINMTGATSETGTAYPSGEPEITPGFSGVPATRSLVLCLCLVDRCFSFCLFILFIMITNKRNTYKSRNVVCSSSIRILITPLVSLIYGF